jgi:hypothetical protein
MTIHPAADFLPPLSEAEFAELKSDIQKRGLREPILKSGDILLDGRHRYRACCELGIEPTFQEFDSNRDFIAEIFSRNVLRRHLSTSERAEIAAKLATTKHGGARRGDQAAKLPLEISQGQAAKMLKISPRSVRLDKAAARNTENEEAPKSSSGQYIRALRASTHSEIPR